jgi:hypothetical protein
MKSNLQKEFQEFCTGCKFVSFDDALTKNQIKAEIFGQRIRQFYFAVEYWPKFFQQIMSNCSCSFGKAKCTSCGILEDNIKDEIGSSHESSHVETFEEFLKAFGCTKPEEPSQLINFFNGILSESASDIIKAVSYAHGIEHTYVKISTMIKTYCEKNGIKQRHYANHEVLDIEHALELKLASDFLLEKTNLDEKIRNEYITTGSDLIMFVFEKMFDKSHG